MKNVKNQNVPMYDQMTEQELNPNLVKARDFEIQNEDLAKKKRALREADTEGKSKFTDS